MIQACEVLGTVDKAGITWSNEEVRNHPSFFNKYRVRLTLVIIIQNLNLHFRAVAAASDDPEFPVRVQAALALTEMVIAHESGAFIVSSLYATS
jgi:hypothetical protein